MKFEKKNLQRAMDSACHVKTENISDRLACDLKINGDPLQDATVFNDP